MAEPRRDDVHDLATELRALGAWLSTPEPPDVRAAVRARLAAGSAATVRDKPGPRFWRTLSRRARRRWIAVAAAIALAVTVAVLPPGRAALAHAVTGLLRFAGVEVHRGEQPRVGPSPSPLPSVRSAALDEARRIARFPVRVPASLGAPDDVQVADPGPDGAPRVVSLLYRGGALRLDEFDGGLEPSFVKTAGQPDTDWVQVNGDIGLWFATTHALVYIDRQGVRREETGRLAAATLIWTDGTVSYRLEGAPSRDEAVAIASSLR